MPREITTPAPMPPMKRSAVRIKIFRRIFKPHFRQPEKVTPFPHAWKRIASDEPGKFAAKV
jgi:hypothetical protein